MLADCLDCQGAGSRLASNCSPIVTAVVQAPAETLKRFARAQRFATIAKGRTKDSNQRCRHAMRLRSVLQPAVLQLLVC